MTTKSHHMGKKAREKVKNGIHYYPRKLFRATTDTLTAVKTQGLFERNFSLFYRAYSLAIIW